MSAKRKPAAARPKWQPPDPYPNGSSVRITGGEHAGREGGRIESAWLGRPGGLNVVHVWFPDMLPSTSVSIPVEHVEVRG